MSDAPPPYANYPRQNSMGHDAAERLQSLASGYYSYGKLFLLHISLVIALRVGTIFLPSAELMVIVFFGGALCVMMLMGYVSYGVNRKVGDGAGWSNGQVILASVFIAFSTVCCGIFAYIILQNIALNNIKKFGLKPGFFGLKKKDVNRRIAELQGLATP